MSQGYNLEFKMYLEGVLTPFKSANIMCTPNGVEASVNMFANKFIYDLKPKTAIQIFYRDWLPVKGVKGWRLMLDGFVSGYVKSDEATEGRMVTLTCSDFRMDIRRAPAALVYMGENDITEQHLYTLHGLYQTSVVKAMSSSDLKKNSKGIPIRQYEDQLSPLWVMMKMIAGTAYGKNADPGSVEKPNQYGYGNFAGTLSSDERGQARCGFFLDAFVRGMWNEAVGGTSVGVFMNKRVRMDKRFFIPKNNQGYNFWSRQNAGLEIGSYVMGNSQFCSLESAIMSCAALFSVRPYSTSTPSLIPVKSNSSAAKYIVDERVIKFLIDNPKAEFGGKFILNSSMLLPPLEFTAPPNCNIFLPPMCNRVSWQYNTDVDVTRGYYEMIDSLSGYDSSDLQKVRYEVPNALFNIYRAESKKDQFGRFKPPLTLEERYKGVNVSHGQVEYELAAAAGAIAKLNVIYNKKMAKELSDRMLVINGDNKASKNKTKKTTANAVAAVESKLGTAAADKVQENSKAAAVEQAKIRVAPEYTQTSTVVAMKRQALIKFLNEKYNGRVVTIDMMFNPYPMCGFPGMFVDDEEAAGGNSSKTVLGMVQQIKHLIYIAPNAAEASTTIVMSNARFVDEPVDIDMDGNLLYMKQTVPKNAEIDPATLTYKAPTYYIPDPSPGTKRQLDSQFYDLQEISKNNEYIYAKDLLTLTVKAQISGESNNLYLDPEYDSQHIAAFYRDVFNHTEDSFMIGRSTDENGRVFPFVYDTMHEAADRLRATKKELMYDYEAAMRYCSRNVCSADAFYQAILGLSVQDGEEFNCHPDGSIPSGEFNDSRIDDEYFGVTTAKYNSTIMDGLKYNPPPAGGGPVQHNGTMTGPGQCSSIFETTPITAFIQERKDAVKNYIKQATNMGQGIRFTTPEVK